MGTTNFGIDEHALRSSAAVESCQNDNEREGGAAGRSGAPVRLHRRIGGCAAGRRYPIRLLHTKANDSQIYRTQLAAIGAAKRYIYIHSPYFSDDEFLAELLGARRRGVDVRVILSTRGDSPIMDRSNVLAANAMFRNGIRVYLYPGFSHAKAAIYDGWACLGSANLDKLSLRVNKELNLATSHRETVQALKQQLFDPDFEKSTEMTRPIEEHWSYYLAELLADQL